MGADWRCVDAAQTMADVAAAGEVLESGTPLSPRRRRLVLTLVVLALLGCGGVWFRDWAAERQLRQAVELTTTFGVASSSTSPPGGSVGYFVLVRNDGPRPVTVTSIDASRQGIRVRMQEAVGRRIEVGRAIDIPLSVRLTCADAVGAAGKGLAAAIGVRREDGGSVTRRVELTPAALVLDVVATLCGVRPGLADRELSGPVLRTG